jgi:hypothetical protein
MSIIRALQNLWRMRRSRAAIVLSRSGWMTDKPNVHVSVAGRCGAMTVWTHQDNDQGRATVEMHASTLARITGLPVTRSDGYVS